MEIPVRYLKFFSSVIEIFSLPTFNSIIIIIQIKTFILLYKCCKMSLSLVFAGAMEHFQTKKAEKCFILTLPNKSWHPFVDVGAHLHPPFMISCHTLKK